MDSTEKEKEKDRTAATPATPRRPHRWARRLGRVLLGILLFIILIPVLLYIPPVQTLVKNEACRVVRNSTGMDIGIGHFGLRFPLKVELEDVYVVEASGDTMVRAGKATVDVALLPLFRLDVRTKKLLLEQGYYRMLSPDSSMLMTIRAGRLLTEGPVRADIRASEILLDRATLSDGSVSLHMDVWKKKETPPDTTSTPFLIKAGHLRLENFRFSMSMLPTIDTLDFQTNLLELNRGTVDLRKNLVTARSVMAVKGGKALFRSPSPEYVKTHPAPPDTTSGAPSPPMVIRMDTISLQGFDALYAVAGAPKTPGLDPSRIGFSGLGITLLDFYNAGSEIRLPVASLRGRENCGLQIAEGYGTFSMDSIGMRLDRFHIATPFSDIRLTAGIPNSLMELSQKAPLDVSGDISLGLADVEAALPSAASYTRLLPKGRPLRLALDLHGELGDAEIRRFDVAMRDVFSLRASGRAANALDFKKLDAALRFDGELASPSLASRLAGLKGVEIPSFRLKGSAAVRNRDYGADFSLLTSAGDVVGKGHVGLGSELYAANLDVSHLDVGRIVSGIPVGPVTLSLRAEGAGFNPERKGTRTSVDLDIARAVYNGIDLSGIRAALKLEKGLFTIDASSTNRDAEFTLAGNGSIEGDLYRFDLTADIRHADLKALGLVKDENAGSGRISLAGSASPAKWLYDLDLNLEDVGWSLADQYYYLPALAMTLKSTGESTFIDLEGDRTLLTFESPRNLKPLVDAFSELGASLPEQIRKRNIDMTALQTKLPPFRLKTDISGHGLVSQFLNGSGMSLDTLYGHIGKDSLISGDFSLLALDTGSTRLDTVRLRLQERNNLLDYALHVGNGPGPMEEFADVNLSGYIGNNRLSSYLTQYNIKGENGYRLGFTAALRDSTVSLHFTPLKARIGYLPWQLNGDNYLDLCLTNLKVQANLKASSDLSSILVKTEPLDTLGTDRLHVKLDNIHVQDFLNLDASLPPIQATVNSDIAVAYRGNQLEGNGTLDVRDFYYDRKRVGDLDFRFSADMQKEGRARASLGLMANGAEAATASIFLSGDSTGRMTPQAMSLDLSGFPLELANPFIDPSLASLSGKLQGGFDVSMKENRPVLDGSLMFDNVAVNLPMTGGSLRMDDEPVTVRQNILQLDRFDIFMSNDHPLTLSGTVDASRLSDIRVDLAAEARDCQLVGNTRGRSEISGKLFMDLTATAKGPLSRMAVDANATVLSATNVVYTMQTASGSISDASSGNVVEFVNLNDTTKVDTGLQQPKSIVGMKVTAALTIQNGAQATVNLSAGGGDKVQLNPSGTLNYYQNYMGDMKLNGTLYTGEGMVRYNIPVIGQKTFRFNPQSNVVFNGDIMNPTIDVTADDDVRANVSTDGNARLVTFIVRLLVKGTLSAPQVLFDLLTNDDMTIQNELSGMSADQRSTTAMNLLLTGQYTGSGAKMVNSNMVTGNLYNFLASQLNSWAASKIKGVDLSFGVDQYQTGAGQDQSTNTSYSYQVSKSLFNNRFKIVVGGNYSTDANADENFSQNLISDISFEYTLRQTNSSSLVAKLYRHTGFESVLEGEITEMGGGFVLKKKLSNLKSLFDFRRMFRSRKRTPAPADSVPADSLQALPAPGRKGESGNQQK